MNPNPFIINSKDIKRKTNDYYPTPPIATESLIFHYKDIIPKRIWEPCCGRGWMSKVLIEHGYDVYSSDLYTYDNCVIPNIEFNKDFLLSDFEESIEGIITNPPYSKNFPENLIIKSLKSVKFVAVLQRLFFLESARRYELFKTTRPDVLVFSNRINFASENNYNNRKAQYPTGGMMAFAWFIWHPTCNGQLNWINPKFEFDNTSTIEGFFS